MHCRSLPQCTKHLSEWRPPTANVARKCRSPIYTLIFIGFVIARRTPCTSPPIREVARNFRCEAFKITMGVAKSETFLSESNEKHLVRRAKYFRSPSRSSLAVWRDNGRGCLKYGGSNITFPPLLTILQRRQLNIFTPRPFPIAPLMSKLAYRS